MLKNTILVSSAVALLTVTSFADNSNRCQGEGHGKHNSKQERKQANKQNRQQHRNSYKDRGELFNAAAEGTLTIEQKESLSYILEEEKVARDVYLELYKTWGIRVFANITKAEQKHMDAVESLFNSYDIEAPIGLSNVGNFENEELQTMYNELVEKGNKSKLDALEVGVIVEETDIADLEALLESTIPSDFEHVYGNLLKGSYNHLKAFNRQIEKQ